MPTKWRARLGSVIVYCSERLEITSLAALVASFGYNIEILLMYKLHQKTTAVEIEVGIGSRL